MTTSCESPVQLWRADNDVILPHPRYAEAVRLALPETPDHHVVPNAGHFDFLVPCSVSREFRRSGRELLQQDTASRVEDLIRPAAGVEPV